MPNRLAPEAQLAIVKRHVSFVAARHPEWDRDDLEGYILESLVRYPAYEVSHVVRRSQLSTLSWQRQILGGRTKKLKWDKVPRCSLDYPLTPTLARHEVIMGDHDVMLEPEQTLPETFLQKFGEADQIILEMLVEGYQQVEIAKVLQTSKATISRRVCNMKPKLAKLLELETG